MRLGVIRHKGRLCLGWEFLKGRIRDGVGEGRGRGRQKTQQDGESQHQGGGTSQTSRQAGVAEGEF